MSESSFEPRFKTLIEVFESATTRFASRPFLATKQAGTWRWTSYQDFGQTTRELCAGLAQLGVTAGDRVAIIANNRPEWALAAYATYGLGAAYVPMYESQQLDEWQYILNDCGAKVLLVATRRILDQIQGVRDQLPGLQHIVVLEPGAAAGHDGSGQRAVLDFAELVRTGKGQPATLRQVPSADLADLIYTSGTTGLPKGVKLSHGNIAYNLSTVYELFDDVTPDDRSLCFLPWAHSFGQTLELHFLFSAGASIAIAEAVDKLVDNMAEIQPTLLFSVPRVFNRIYERLNKQIAAGSPLKQRLFQAAMRNEARRKQLTAQGQRSAACELKHGFFDKLVFTKVRSRFGGRLRYALSGGAAISREVAEFIDNLGITVYEGYGLTETSPLATVNSPLAGRKIGSVGKALPGVRIVIDHEASGDAQQGEVVIYGHNVMQGYHGLPEENDKVFTADGGFRTGDLGYLDADGFLYLTGRIKEQYKLENGKYVAPAPLEEQLKLSPYVSNCFIYGDNRPYNVAVVVPNMEELASWARNQGITADGAALLEDPRTVQFMTSEIDSFSTDFKQFERIKKLVLVAEDFTVENGMLTPKLSLKRREVMKRWGDRIDTLYAPSAVVKSA